MKSTMVTIRSIRPEAIRSPRLAGGRSSATPSPVTRSSVVIVANSAAGCVDIGPQSFRWLRCERSEPRNPGPRTLAPVPRIDLDAYVVAHSHEWARLDQLVRARRLTGPESDELVDRYQQVATHLSVIRTSAPDAEVVAYLSSLLGRARISMLGARVLSWRAVGRFFTEQFPAALYRLRWWWLGCMAGNVIVTAVLMWWLVDHPQVEQSLLSRRGDRRPRQQRLRELLQRERRPAPSRPGSGSTTPG